MVAGRNLGDQLTEEQAAQIPGLAPEPMLVLTNVVQRVLSDGKIVVFVEMQTKAGKNWYTLSGAGAIEHGEDLIKYGRASASGVLLPEG